jgi:hypothetical protein
LHISVGKQTALVIFILICVLYLQTDINNCLINHDDTKILIMRAGLERHKAFYSREFRMLSGSRHTS